jgi:hypothetical protein
VRYELNVFDVLGSEIQALVKDEDDSFEVETGNVKRKTRGVK